MTLKEFRTKNCDVVLDPVGPEDLDRLACGAALLYVSLSGGNRPKDDRTVLWAGHVLTAGMYDGDRQILLVRLTQYGNVKLDTVEISALEPGGRAALFTTAPFTKHDPRVSLPWKEWD